MPRLNNSEILESIRKQIGSDKLFHGNSFKKGNCSADISGVSENDRVVIDLDKVFPDGQQGMNQCECVIFYFDDTDNLIVVPIELKGGKNAEVEKAVEQLKGGTVYADNFTPSDTKTVLYPILFHNSLSRAEVRRLKHHQSRIQFHGKTYEVKTARCGSKLIDVIP